MPTTTILSIDFALVTAVRALEKEIGHTPLHRFSRLLQQPHLQISPHVQIYAKKEWMQLSGSVKARAGYNIIRRAIEEGALTTDKTLLDATSGNTGIDRKSVV